MTTELLPVALLDYGGGNVHWLATRLPDLAAVDGPPVVPAGA